MLHLIFQSPLETAVLERIDSGDELVFLGNAALCTLKNSSISKTLTEKLSSNRLFVLSDDIVVRGIVPDELVKGVEVIDYIGLVALTINSPIIQSWT
jgi:tRNA 2-thiouridine synthesizing protein B